MPDFTITPNTVLCLAAPTASGKTALAYQLYDTEKYELISVDSALIYQDMNIGTAKPTDSELIRYPHHLVDIMPPTESYNVADFVTDVDRLVKKIHQRGKIPLLVGGTMMYYMALFEGISNVPTTDDSIRDFVEKWRQSEGIADLYHYLSIHDPQIADKLKIGDTQRITRAVEVYKQTNKPMSYWQAMPKTALADDSAQNWIGISIMPDRNWLHQRIALRLEMMWTAGFFDEVIGLIEKYPLLSSMPSMRCVGYRQVIDFLLFNNYVEMVDGVLIITDNLNNFDTKILRSNPNFTGIEGCQDMQNKALYATRQLAKRQYTWLRKFIKQNNVYNFNSIENVKQLLT